jgi:hypothetical protein
MNITITLGEDSAMLVVMAMKDSANELISAGDDALAEMVRNIANAISKEIDRQSGLKS